MINAPSNKDRLTATSNWPIVSIANLVSHTKRLTVPQVGLVEEADICLCGKQTGPIPPPYGTHH